MTIRWAITIGTACAITTAGGGMGCAGSLPRYEWLGREGALDTMNERANQIETVSASGRLSLHRENGADVQLDCAMAYRKPDRFRLRAWKFSRAVLDFTMHGDDVWIVAPDRKGSGERKLGESGLPDSLSADHIATSWSLIVSGFSPELWTPCASSHTNTFALQGNSDMETNGITCEIDRVTLTTRLCYVHDDEGEKLFILTFRRYRRYGENVFPTRIRASNSSNAFTWLLDEIHINEPLAPRALLPPRRAVKQP